MEDELLVSALCLSVFIFFSCRGAALFKLSSINQQAQTKELFKQGGFTSLHARLGGRCRRYHELSKATYTT